MTKNADQLGLIAVHAFGACADLGAALNEIGGAFELTPEGLTVKTLSTARSDAQSAVDRIDRLIALVKHLEEG